MGAFVIEPVTGVHQVVELGGPGHQGGKQGQDQHRALDEEGRQGNAAVIGGKKERENRDKTGPGIKNLYSGIRLISVAAGKFKKVAEQKNNRRGLEEHEIVLFCTLTPEKSVNPGIKRHGQSYTDNNN
jgi:hypothetical protein